MSKVNERSAGDPVVPPDWVGLNVHRVGYEAGAPIFGQGDPATHVMYVETGTVRLSVISRAGKQAVIAVVERGHFFGEGCMAGQPLRIVTATAITPATIIEITKSDMATHLSSHPGFSDRFLSHMLNRNIRIEEDLIDQLFNSSEKRLARTLLLLAHDGEPEGAHRTLPRVSQQTLAEMIGSTRSRVNFFMNKFRKLGFIEYDGDLKIHNARLAVVLRD